MCVLLHITPRQKKTNVTVHQPQVLLQTVKDDNSKTFNIEKKKNHPYSYVILGYGQSLL